MTFSLRVFVVALLMLTGGCTGAPEPVAEIETTGDLQQQRICLDAGTYTVEALAPDNEVAATAFLTLDDGTEEGSYVTAALRVRGDTLSVRSELVTLEGGSCYWLSIQTGVAGRTTRALLWRSTDG